MATRYGPTSLHERTYRICSLWSTIISLEEREKWIILLTRRLRPASNTRVSSYDLTLIWRRIFGSRRRFFFFGFLTYSEHFLLLSVYVFRAFSSSTIAALIKMPFYYRAVVICTARYVPCTNVKGYLFRRRIRRVILEYSPTILARTGRVNDDFTK